jgi:bifunctional non-homologous end joining protein LigD
VVGARRGDRYIDFEGVIPEGSYGAGTVIVWDKGTWLPEGDPDEAYRRGALKFTLFGKRLKGGWALVRMNRGGNKKNWLLIKERDAYAHPGSGAEIVEKYQTSVLSRRSLETVRVWASKDAQRRSEKSSRKVQLAPLDPSEITGARKAPLPTKLMPQLATLVAEAPDGDDWLHEIKFDGYRMIARLDRGSVTMLSRNGKDWTRRFPEIEKELGILPVKSAVLDGEVVHLEPNGVTSFAALKADLSAGKTDGLVYYVFDLLYLDGYLLTVAALEARKATLHRLLGSGDPGRVRHTVGGLY